MNAAVQLTILFRRFDILFILGVGLGVLVNIIVGAVFGEDLLYVGNVMFELF